MASGTVIVVVLGRWLSSRSRAVRDNTVAERCLRARRGLLGVRYCFSCRTDGSAFGSRAAYATIGRCR